MAESQNFVFNHREIAAALVKQQGIHEGLWGIYIEFGIAGINVDQGAGDGKNLVPAAIVPVLKIGVQRFPEANNLTVDAAQVNPETPRLTSPIRKKTDKKRTSTK
ncbi:MAG: hypothetical protein HY870_12275 [Chloroflexi bacterium]|nr:hypothetical protein [Chloroflexota bacterium]